MYVIPSYDLPDLESYQQKEQEDAALKHSQDSEGCGKQTAIVREF